MVGAHMPVRSPEWPDNGKRGVRSRVDRVPLLSNPARHGRRRWVVLAQAKQAPAFRARSWSLRRVSLTCVYERERRAATGGTGEVPVRARISDSPSPPWLDPVRAMRNEEMIEIIPTRLTRTVRIVHPVNCYAPEAVISCGHTRRLSLSESPGSWR
jgi:hypothetical protein